METSSTEQVEEADPLENDAALCAGEESIKEVAHNAEASNAAGASGEEDPTASKDDEAEEDFGPPENAEGVQQKEQDKGKEEYNNGNYEEAIKAWNMSLKSVKYILDKGFYKNNAKQMEEVHQIHMRVHLNLAQAYLKVRDWTQAIEYADKVLNVDECHTKALYRKAVALDEMGKFEEAVSTLERLQELEPENRACQALLAKARRNALEFSREQKKAAKKMFAAFSVDRDPRVADSRSEYSRFGSADSTGLLLRCRRRFREAAAGPQAWPWLQAIWRQLEAWGILEPDKAD